MKSLICVLSAVILLSISATAANSPIDRGSTILGGGVSIGNYSGDLYGSKSQTVITFAPSIGYFFSPGVMAGLELNYEFISQGGASTESYGFGPTVGYYFKLNSSSSEVKGSAYPYLRAFFIYSSISKGTYKQTSYGAQGGFLFMLSYFVAADLGLRFSRDKEEFEFGGYEYGDGPSTYSATGTAIQLSVGITAFLY